MHFFTPYITFNKLGSVHWASQNMKITVIAQAMWSNSTPNSSPIGNLQKSDSSHHCCSRCVFFLSELVKRRAGYFHHELIVLTSNLKTSCHVNCYIYTCRLHENWCWSGVNLTSTHWSQWSVCHPEGKTLYGWFTIKHELIVCRPYNLNE